MRYIAVFDIPDDYGYGCPIVKACPNDAEHDTIFAKQMVKMDDFQKPKTIEADFYRRNTLDHMEAAGFQKITVDPLKEPENVWKETVRINTAKGTSGAYQRWAFYVGQLYLLDTIKKMQKTYIGLSELFGNSEQLPSAQPEPRTAYWTKDIVGTVVCSNCGGIRRDNRIGHTQWCNCCGCFMRGEEND